MKSLYRGIIFWCVGGIIFWTIEAIVNTLKGTLSSFNWDLFIIVGMYIVLAAIGALIFWGIYSMLSRFAKDKMDSDCFFIATFTFSSILLYSFIWMNDKNPDPFFSRMSILLDFFLLLLCFIFSVVIYSGFIQLKKRKNLLASYLAYSVSLDSFIVFAAYFNWQLYRESVSTLEKYLTFNTLLFNIFIIAGCVLLCILIYNIVLFLIKNFSIKKHIKTVSIIFLPLIITTSIIYPSRQNSMSKELSSRPSFNSEEKPNVLLFLMDTLRADHVGCYGYPRDTTPNIDELSKSAILFENCISPGPLTQLIMPSLLTSRYITFTARKKYEYVNSLVRLQEILKLNGYQTSCFVGFNWAYQLIGLDKGFDYFFTRYGLFYEFFLPKGYITLRNAFTKDKDAWEFSFDTMEDKLFSWLGENKENKFFTYVHVTDIHAPYRTPSTYKKRFYSGTEKEEHLLTEEWRVKQNNFPPEKIKHIIDIYDDSIRSTDFFVRKLIDKLKELGIFDKTLLIFISDHGESFLEHGYSNHGRSLFEEEIRVPLIIRYPKSLKQNERIPDIVSLLDIMPTTLDLLNIEIKEELDGKSFLGLILRGEEKKIKHREFVFSEKEGNFSCVRTKKWKLIICEKSKEKFFGTKTFGHKEIKELYDLENDPLELHNIYDERCKNKEIVELEKKLVNHINFMKNLGK